LYNTGRDGDIPGICGIGGCWCCYRPRIEQSESHRKCYYDVDETVEINDNYVELIFDTWNSGETALLNPGESDRRYSNVHDNEIEKKLSMLDSPYAWIQQCTRSEPEWMEIDLGSSKHIVGIVTQGRRDANQWVK
jgi:hypothetical protein